MHYGQPTFWGYGDNKAIGMRLDVNGWTRLQNPLPGDETDANGPAKPLHELKRPRGKPEELEKGEKGWFIIPPAVMKSDSRHYRRDVFQTFVRCSWGECYAL
jgi:hypothetical protein